MKRTFNGWKKFWQEDVPLKENVNEQTGRGRDVSLSGIASDIKGTLINFGFDLDSPFVVLDIGCGNGLLADMIFHGTEAEYYGIDYSSALIEKAPCNLTLSDVNLISEDILSEEFDGIGKKAQLVIGYSITRFFPGDNMEALIDAITRVLERGGMVFLGDVEQENVKSIVGLLEEKGFDPVKVRNQASMLPYWDHRKDILAWRTEKT